MIQWSLLDKLHCLALQTAAVTSTLVLVFYWAFVVDSSQTVLPDDYLQHAASAPIMLLDVWFSKVPFVSYHLQVRIGHLFCMCSPSSGIMVAQHMMSCSVQCSAMI